jgi:predicted porin
MKKTLIALAALASTAAFAQSSVTLSGRLDLGMVNNTTTNTVGTNEVSTKVTDLTGNQNGRTTSRLTFAGVEDLGGGLKASFNVETALNPSDESALFAGNTRNGSISLMTANMGTFSIGTFTSNGIDAVRGFSASTYSIGGGDFLANTASGAQMKSLVEASASRALVVGGNANPTAAQIKTASAAELGVTEAQYDAATLGMSGRSRNAIAYTSPSFNGFTASLGLHNQKNVTANTKTTGSIIGLAYVNGPLTAHVAIGNQKSSNSTSGALNGKNSDNAFGLSYNVGVAVPYFVYEASKVTLANNDEVKANAMEVGARFPMGALTPYVAVASGSHKSEGEKFAKSSGFQIGTTYDLSKRTYVYLAAGQDKVKAVNVNANVKRSSYAAGVVHSF